MKISKLLAGTIVSFLILGGLFLFKSNNKSEVYSSTSDVISGDIQQIVLGEKNLNYYPSEIVVKSGKPVSILLDSSVTGCLRSFTIIELGISKYARTPQDTIDFTPTKKGTFRFTCSMGMGY